MPFRRSAESARNPPNAAPLTVPSLLLVTTGRKSGQKFLFPLFYLIS